MTLTRNHTNIVVLLSTAFITILGREKNTLQREQQYISGINQIVDYCSFKGVDIAISDNTITLDTILPDSVNVVIDKIDNSRRFFFNENKYGQVNKGAGLLAQWKYCLPYLRNKYSYVVHYEPRHFINSFSFFDLCLNNKENVFRLDSPIVYKYGFFPYKYKHFQTGLIGANITTLVDFSNQQDVRLMVESSLSIEDLLYKFLIKNKIKFNCVKKLGLIWHSEQGDMEI